MPPVPPPDVFIAIADPTRRRLIALLGEAERSVSELTERFSITMSAISQHLAILRDAGLVQMRRVGRSHRYRLDPAPLHAVTAWITAHTHFWDARMEALRSQVEDQS